MNKQDYSSHFIGCPRFGGRRFAPSCVTQDRYRTCRRNCDALQDHMVKYPDLVEKSVDLYEKRRQKPESGDLVRLVSMKSAGKNLPPDPEMECTERWCKFVAKTKRGLRIHLLRTHNIGRKAPKQKRRKRKKGKRIRKIKSA